MSSQTQTVDLVMVDSSHDFHLFNEATAAVQVTILEVHRKDFPQDASASLLLDEFQSSSTSASPYEQKLVVCSQKFALFTRNFAAYFDILSLCVHLRPEWASALWGTVRLIFKISSNYPVFLEKIADMFEHLAQIAAPYRQIYDICKRNALDSQFSVEEYHLAALLSNVYSDVVHFCLDIYILFGRGVSAHSADGELHSFTNGAHQSSPWRPLDYRFAQLESRLIHHRKWLEKETEGRAQNYSEVALSRQEYVDYLNRGVDTKSNSRTEPEEQIVATRRRRIDKVKKWLSNGYSIPQKEIHGAYEPLIESRDWFFKTLAFHKWRDPPFNGKNADNVHSLEADWQHRNLFVQAKEGFGKTIIAKEVTRILEVDGEGVDPSDEPYVTASFHFDATHPESCRADYTIRSLATQLLHTHCRDRRTLDTACLLLRRTSFRETGTTEEVLDVLCLLLHQHATYLVIDGLDECSDPETFLTFLAQACRKSDTRAIVFSRPDIKIPLEYQKWASDAPHILTLASEHNAATIEHYVAQSLNQMADQGFFGISIDRTIIPHVAEVSNGSFLWVRMLLLLLQSVVLTAEERYAILQNIQFLEGLEPLYRNILGALARRPSRERRLMANAFRWLLFSIHGLSPTALRAALSIAEETSGKEAHEDSLVDTLPELTCGLLHLENKTLTFAHRSIPKYLRASASQPSEFSLHDENEVHAHLAARCLSYLTHHVPHQPLVDLQPGSPPLPPTIAPSSGASQRSGDSGYKSLSSSSSSTIALQPVPPSTETNPPDETPFDAYLPLLRYATLTWPIHLSRALSPPYTTTLPYLTPLTSFFSSPLALTVWVEASYRYNLPPTLSRLVGPLSDLKAGISPATVRGREVRDVVGRMRGVSAWLVALKEGGLRGSPGEVWEGLREGRE